MSEPKPRFTGIFIPVEILEIEDLSFFDMLLLSWIDALYDHQAGGCYASNKYLGSKLKGAKENTVAKSITKLRQKGLIEDVFFDGRQRVIRALIGRHIDKVQSNADLDKNPRGVGFLSNPELDFCPSSPYIESKVESKVENTPPNPQRGRSAIADRVGVNNFSKSPKKKKVAKASDPKVSEATRELFPKFVAVIREFKPDYVVRDEPNMLRYLDKLLDEGRDPKEILRVMEWAVNDNVIRGDWNGWSSKVLCKNPCAYLYNKYDQISTASKAKKERKFCPGSDDDRGLQALEEAFARAIR